MRSLHARWLFCSAEEWYSRIVLQSVRNGRAALDMALEGLLEGHHRPLKAVRRLSPRESGVELSARMFFGAWRAAVSGRIAFAVCGWHGWDLGMGAVPGTVALA